MGGGEIFVPRRKGFLSPIWATEAFWRPRENIRMPTMGYSHIPHSVVFIVTKDQKGNPLAVLGFV